MQGTGKADFNNHKGVRADTADVFLLPIPSLNSTNKHGLKKGVTASTLNFLQGLFVKESMNEMYEGQGKNSSRDSRTKTVDTTNSSNNVRIISRSPVVLMASKVSLSLGCGELC